MNYSTLSDLMTDIRNKLEHIGNNQHNLLDKLEKNLEYYLAVEATHLKMQLLSSGRYDDKKNLIPFGFKVFSENEEDGMIEEIFNRIGTSNKRFIEFGVEAGLENNTLYLLHKDWNGLWIEGKKSEYEKILENVDYFINKKRLTVVNKFLTKDNINKTFSDNGITGEIDLLVIDVDGNDFHLLEAVTAVSPRVVVIEYNARFPAHFSWIMEYDPNHLWSASSYYGASLKAYENLMKEKSYSLVGCNLAGNNAFFVRDDEIGEHFQGPFVSEVHYEPNRYHLSLGYAHDRNFRPKIGPHK